MSNPITPATSRRDAFFDYVKILVGSAIFAAGIDMFMVPNQVVGGGLTGLAVIANHWFGWGVGLVALILNLPVLWLGWKYVGGTSFFLRTLVGVVALSAFIDLFAPLLPVVTDDRLLVIFYGGLSGGIGLALVFHGKGTTGGVDILAQLAHRWLGVDVGQAMLIINTVVLVLAGVVFGPEPAMVALLLAWVVSKSLDAVLHGLSASRQAIIISEHYEEITASILQNLDRGVTVLDGHGGFSGETRKVLYVVVQRHEAQRLKARIDEIDPNAFVVISSPSEVRGGYPMPWQN